MRNGLWFGLALVALMGCDFNPQPDIPGGQPSIGSGTSASTGGKCSSTCDNDMGAGGASSAGTTGATSGAGTPANADGGLDGGGGAGENGSGGAGGAGGGDGGVGDAGPKDAG